MTKQQNPDHLPDVGKMVENPIREALTDLDTKAPHSLSIAGEFAKRDKAHANLDKLAPLIEELIREAKHKEYDCGCGEEYCCDFCDAYLEIIEAGWPVSDGE